jgi:Uma2 family endonuclease
MGEAAQVIPRAFDAAELWRRQDELGPCELIDGEVVAVPPAKFEHGKVAMTVGWALSDYVRRRMPQAIVVTCDVGYQIDSENVRAPDVALHFEPPAARAEGWEIAVPDLVVEVVSPNDRFTDVEAKVDGWLRFGVREVWAIDPQRRRVAVRTDERSARIAVDGALTTPLLPEFALPLETLFA